MLRPSLVVLLISMVSSTTAAQKDTSGTPIRSTPALKAMVKGVGVKDSIDLVLVTTNPKEVQKAGARILNQYAPASSIQVRISRNDLPVLLSGRQFRFADLATTPKEELTTGSLDLMTNYANFVPRTYPTLRGDSLLTSIKERSFDTTDIDYAYRYRRTATPSAVVTAHASIMATTIAGAANSSPYAKGVADKSLVTSSDFANLLPDPDAQFQQHNISVQNHSYGTAIQNYYGVEAAAYDVSARNNTTLLHVFSSGNSGTQTPIDGPYAGIPGLSNLVGNFKMAKNVLTVGAIDSFYRVSPLSSKGPAFDGRIKPELVAFGEDGSSGAAAMVSGSALLQQQAFKRLHQSLPSSALVKAVLLNGADDLGAPGPDYGSGYGSLNTFRSVQTIDQNRYREGSIATNNTSSFEVTVPKGVSQLKVTLAWIDPAAEPAAPRALINDLDLMVKNTTTGQEWLPWVLNTSPHKDSLLLTAQKGRDTLNNAEQVTIDDPAAGIYTIEVRGSRISTSNQPFAIAYSLDTANTFYWTYPTAINGVEGGKTNILRWWSNSKLPGLIEYTADGTTWQELATVPDLSARFYKWEAPDTFTTALLRMRLPTQTVRTDTFTISNPTRLHTGFQCVDSFLLYWNKLPVQAYQLYALQDGYLQPFRSTPDTAVILKKAQNPSIYYTVAPLIQGKPGQRSFILNYTAQGTDCYLQSFYLQLQDFFAATFNASLGTVYNVASVSFQKFQDKQYKTLRTVSPPGVTHFLFTDSVLTRGVNKYRLQITLANGQVIYSNEVTTYHYVYGEVILYPNPAPQNEGVNVITSRGGRVALEVYSQSGVRVLSMKLTNQWQQLPAHKLPKGLYIVKVLHDDGTVFHQKLLIQ